MGILGSTIGGALGIGGSIFGGISASNAMKKLRRNLQEQQRENQDWYNRRYNEDATQRVDAQRILTKAEEFIKNRNRQAAGVQAMMGGTEESVAATKAANNQVLADATSQIAENGERRKDRIEQSYQQKDAQIQEALNNLELKKATSVGNAVQGVASAAAGIAGAF